MGRVYEVVSGSVFSIDSLLNIPSLLFCENDVLFFPQFVIYGFRVKYCVGCFSCVIFGGFLGVF